MKKKLKLNLLALLSICLTISLFSSCSDDDDNEDYKGYGNLELTINGKTYERKDILGLSGADPWGNNYSLRDISCGFLETPDVDIYIYLIYYTNQKYFKDAQPGEFRIIDDYFNGCKNFDLEFTTNIDGNGEYKYVSGGKHIVSNTKLLSTDTNTGILTYLIEGDFSCSFKHTLDNKTLKISGKYWTKIHVNPESKS